MVVAILRQAGSFEAVLSAITEAEADWRDLLMATVLAPEDWPLVVEKNGIPLSGDLSRST